jgi:phosphoribosylglycinamide formyltransferase-1
MSEHKPIRLAVLISGSGTTLQNLLDLIVAGELGATINLVIGSRPNLPGQDRAASAGLPHCVVDRHSFKTQSEFSHAVFDRLDQADVDLVCLAGWLCLLEIPPRYTGRVMNIHPALLPSFGGKGMYGPRVHQAVLDHGCKVSGCTVHFVDNTFDAGPIILQRAAPVLEDDTADSLAHRVFAQEKLAYPAAIRLFAAGKLHVNGRRVAVSEWKEIKHGDHGAHGEEQI